MQHIAQRALRCPPPATSAWSSLLKRTTMKKNAICGFFNSFFDVCVPKMRGSCPVALCTTLVAVALHTHVVANPTITLAVGYMQLGQQTQ